MRIREKMLDDLLEAESQADPHAWSAPFCAHCWIALGPWGVIAITWNAWLAAWVVPLAYLLVWEGTQLVIAWRRGKFTYFLVWDSICDTVAVAFGCYAAASARHGIYLDAMLYWCASLIVCVIGWVRRANR